MRIEPSIPIIDATQAIMMREDAEKHGPIRYIINTEHHIDHIFGNYFFKGSGIVVSHIDVYNNKRVCLKDTPACWLNG